MQRMYVFERRGLEMNGIWADLAASGRGLRRLAQFRSVLWLAALLFMASWVSGCGYDQVIHSWVDRSANSGPSAVAKLPGQAYLLRGLTSIYSYGMDQLADKITHRGVTATVYGLTEIDTLADDIIRKYRAGEDRGPIVLIGHSSGVDRAITTAQKLKEADAPVALIFGFDPTRGADPVPPNVELFINLYQRYNPIGGGEAIPGPGFRGRLINIDLHEHTEIVHITLDKTPEIQDAVAAKVEAVAAYAARRPRPSGAKQVGPIADLLPLVLKYTVPRDAPIELWDSAIKVNVNPGDTTESIALAHHVPSWAIVQINALTPDRPLEPGRSLIVPDNLYADAALSVAPIRHRHNSVGFRADGSAAAPKSSPQ